MNRKDRRVLQVAIAIVDEGSETFGAAVIAQRLRQEGQPLWLWEIRQALTVLAREGAISVDPATAAWRLEEPARACA
jgi:hypothetical protein